MIVPNCMISSILIMRLLSIIIVSLLKLDICLKNTNIRMISWKYLYCCILTCELHDSYFRFMTIKHAIPKTAEVTNSDGQLWGDIEWAIEQLYNSVKTGSQLV